MTSPLILVLHGRSSLVRWSCRSGMFLGRSQVRRCHPGSVAEGLRLFKNATSLGGVESLVEHRAPIEGPDTPVPEDLLRLSIGIEAVDDLRADLEQALAGL